jgi:predicted permease
MNLRYAIRTLARTPGFTLVAVATLALGIGGTTAMLAIVNGVLFKPLHFPGADTLYTVHTVVTAESGGRPVTREFPVSGRHYIEWREHCGSCEAIALVDGRGFTLTGTGEPNRIPGLNVSSNFFQTLGVRMQLGRDFTPAEEGPGAHVAVLSNALWRSTFSADPSVIGRSVTLNGAPTTIVGVTPSDLRLPRGFEWGPFFRQSLAPDVFVPFPQDFSGVRTVGNFNYVALVRIRSGATPIQTEGQLSGDIAAFAQQAGIKMNAVLTPLFESVTGASRKSLWLLLAAVGAVLTLVSLNIGGLLLARSMARAHETSVRLALGARPRDLAAPVAGEVLLLMLASSIIGALLAVGAVVTFVAAAPVALARIDEIRPDWHVALFAIAATGASGMLAAIAPIVRAATGQESLTSATRTSTENRRGVNVLDLVMTLEIALSTMVLVVGVLFVTSFLNVMRSERGFSAQHVVTESLALSSSKYATPVDMNRFVDAALRAFSTIPGVSEVGVTSQLPLRGEAWVDALVDADRRTDERNAPLTNRRFVSPHFVSAMGIPVIAGRDLDDADRGRRVVIISEHAARLLWPGGTAIGRHVQGNDRPRANAPLFSDEVVGVVADVKSEGLEKDPAPIVYVPYWNFSANPPAFVFRTARDAASIAADIRSNVARLDPDLPIPPPETMEGIVSDAASVRRFQTTVVVAFTALALMIAAIGLYGLVSFSVSRRTRELGLRVALGATSSRVIALVLLRGMRPVAAGGLLGLLGAAAGGRLLTDQLYGISSHDARALGAVATTLFAVAIAACWVPARRATRLDPMIPLRAE